MIDDYDSHTIRAGVRQIVSVSLEASILPEQSKKQLVQNCQSFEEGLS